MAAPNPVGIETRMPKELSETEFKEMVCKRMRLAQEVSGLNKKTFAKSVGLSPSQLTNIFRCRNKPSPTVIANAAREYGFTTDFFYTGDRGGMRDPQLPGKIRMAAIKLHIHDY